MIRAGRILIILRCGLLTAAASAVLGSAPAYGYPNPGRVAGNTNIADPSMVVKSFDLCGCGGDPRYLVFGTNNQTRGSEDRITFADIGPIFPLTPAWWKPYSGAAAGNSDMWAPDASFHNGIYWLYYAVSTVGSQQHSAIGVATSATGLPGTWTDHGPVLASASGDPYNAIDPNLVVDAAGNWWLVFGSYYHGIYAVALDSSTGMLADPSAPTFYHLAEKPTSPSYTWYDDDRENPFVYQHGGYYYLFISAGKCCAGTSSTYHIIVGRSSSITGPYLDFSPTPKDMLQGGGTTILASHGNVIGPGGESVVGDDYFGYHDVLVYHYYDATTPLGISTLGINFLGWDSQGAPYVF